MTAEYPKIAGELAKMFARLPQVEAVALGGSRSRGSGASDTASDLDLYVYTHAAISLAERQAIVVESGGATRADLLLDYWGPGDEWYHAPSGLEVDIVYFDTAWMENQIERVVRQAQPSMGYTTCLWYTLRHSVILSDPHGWLAELQHRSDIAYPEELRRAIITFNHPVLRQIIPSYAHQMEKAARRGDLISVNHRLAALFASYFDVLFAFNRVLHPGEKRLLEFAVAECPRLPESMEKDVNEVLRASCVDLPGLAGHISRLLYRLDAVLKEDGLI